ncbi:MAG: galactokinase family protein [Clostridia bacterium]
MATINDDFFCKNVYFDQICTTIYKTDGEKQKARFLELVKMHKETFNLDDLDFYSSPGRIEIVGNHTDHNGGKVLAAAINVDTLASVSSRTDGIIEVKSKGYPMLKVDTSNVKFDVREVGTSNALIKGVVDYFIRSGKQVGGFSACMTSSVPKGSGVSSSSSFELAIAEILNVLFNGGNLDAVFKAKASQYAENTYFGKPCGLMDQSAIALGGVNLIDFKSFTNPIIDKAHWAFDDLDIFVIATGGDHANLTDDYAAIPFEMKEVAECFGAKLLCEIPRARFDSGKQNIKNKVSERAYLRAEHYYEENERVEKAFSAIGNLDEQAFLDAVNASGLSSKHKLQNLFSPAGGNHNLEYALDRVEKIDGVVAKRVHGGGFAGTILVFVKTQFSSGAKAAFNVMFGDENVFELAIRDSGAIKLPIGR